MAHRSFSAEKSVATSEHSTEVNHNDFETTTQAAAQPSFLDRYRDRVGNVSRRHKRTLVALGIGAAAAFIAVVTPVGDRIMDTLNPQFTCENTVTKPGDTVLSLVETHDTSGYDPEIATQKTLDENPQLESGELEPNQVIVLCTQQKR